MVAAVAVAATTGAGPTPAAAAEQAAPVIVGITAGSGHSLGLDDDGAIYAWGGNTSGQLGDGTTDAALTPKPLTDRGEIPADVQIVQVVAAGTRSLALGDDGKVYGWGANGDGQLGDGSTAARAKPVAAVAGTIPAGVKIVRISASASSTYAVGDDGRAYAWGANGSGLLGDGTTVARQAPVAVAQGEVPAGVKLVDIAAGEAGSHVIALGDDGKAYAWGPGGNGRLGTGSTESSTTPVAVAQGAIPAGVKLVRAGVGIGNSLALGDDGAVYAWGDALFGALGDGTASGSRPTPVRVSTGAVPAGVKLVDLTVLARSSVALGDDGKAYVWGYNMYGQVGDGTTVNRTTPVALAQGAIPAGVRLTAVGGKHYAATALGDDGRAYAWGNNGSGQLGDDTRTHRSVPIAVGFEGGAVQPTTVTLSTPGALVEDEQFTMVAELSPAEATGTVTFRIASLSGFRPVVVSGGTAQVTQTAPGVGEFTLIAEFVSDQPLVYASSTATLTVTFAQSPTPKVKPAMDGLSGTLGTSANPPLIVTLVDGDTPAEQLTLSAQSDSADLLPTSNITISGTGATRTVTFRPIGTVSGIANVTFTARDPQGRTSSTEVRYAVSRALTSPTASYYFGASDASAAIDVGDGYVVVADDESQTLRLYERGGNAYPVKEFDFARDSGFGEVDLESATRRGDTIYWLGSYGNSSSSGDARPERRTLFTTTVTGSGADTELTFGTLYAQTESLFADLVAWDANNGHGLGENALKFTAATQPGVFPFAPNGFGIEGFEFGPGSSSVGYLGFRGPSITVDGAQRGLIVPVNNFEQVVAQAAKAEFGAPILLDLGGRTIRDIRKNANDDYLIVAGPIGGEGWALYTWNGRPDSAAVFNRDLPTLNSNLGGAWEAIVAVPDRLAAGAEVALITDSGDSLLYDVKTATKDYPPPLRKAYTDTFALGEVPGAELALVPSASTKVLAGKVYVSVSVRNASGVTADVNVESAFGSKSFAGVAPGQTVSVAFNTRAASVPAGEVTVSGVGADGSTFDGVVSFPAAG